MTQTTLSSNRSDLGTHGRELILDAQNIAVDFKVDDGIVHGVEDVSFQLHRGETIALVGESGSGKSVTARTIMGLLTKRAKVSAKSIIKLNGEVIDKAWPIGKNASQGVGLQKESGDFDFRNVRLKEKK